MYRGFRYTEIWIAGQVHWRAADGYEIDHKAGLWLVSCRGIVIATYERISGCVLGEL
jgi:hypothetical protein